MDIGLQKCNTESEILMLPSRITRRPTGQEKGEYIGLDLSGSYVRVYLVTLQSQGRIKTRQAKHTVKGYLKQGHISKLIDVMTECVDCFLSHVQAAINNAYVLRWTKDFSITGGEQKNLVDHLQTSFRRREIPVLIKAVVNGAAGCLLADSYRSLVTLLTCTVSTGTNAVNLGIVSKVVFFFFFESTAQGSVSPLFRNTQYLYPTEIK
ncbi:hypothetical protein BD560DRAFT_467817 [Blakeslea trispora]|nr:hypothetical protein BD560DRAFT_467817 [Blakeslea trispora]